jgi:hypothetical protein
LLAQSNIPETPPSTKAAPSTKVVALGELVPQGDVITVANAQDSRVNHILLKEGDSDIALACVSSRRYFTIFDLRSIQNTLRIGSRQSPAPQSVRFDSTIARRES